MKETTNTDIRHRVKGRQSIERRLMRLLLATGRFSQHRATAPADLAWAGRLIDVLSQALRVSRAGQTHPGPVKCAAYASPETGMGCRANET